MTETGGGKFTATCFLLNNVIQKKTATKVTVFRTPSGTRTLDPLIKSQLLYQLS